MSSGAGVGQYRYDDSQRNLDGYGTPPIDWARVEAVLDSRLTQAPGTGGPQRHTVWLTTIDPDGRPHVRPVGVVQHDGSWYFTSGPATRKSRNLARDPDACSAWPPTRSTSSLRAPPNLSPIMAN